MTRRLVALIVVGVAGALVVGGLRVESALNAAAGYARTTQLAVLGGQVTALAQALENERDLSAGVDAAMGQDAASAPAGFKPVAYTAVQVRAYQGAVILAQQATDAISGRVSAAAARIGVTFPALARSNARDVIGIVSNIAGLRSAATSQRSLDTIENYDETIANLFAINDEFTSGSGDPVLGDGGRTLDAISRAQDQVSQQRAILYAALIGGRFATGAQQALVTSQAMQSAYLRAFQSSATTAEVDSYTRTVAGVPVDSAQFLINYLSTQGLPGTLAQQTAQALGRQSATQAPRQYYADMSATLVKMRRVELQVAQGIVARGQSLRQDARRSALLSAAVTVAIALAVLLATFLASRSRDGDDRARGRTARNAASGGV